jgi:hypothetical protein
MDQKVLAERRPGRHAVNPAPPCAKCAPSAVGNQFENGRATSLFFQI